MNWKSIKKGEFPPDNSINKVIVAVTNGNDKWVTCDTFDGYTKTFELNYCPKNTYGVYKWKFLPDVPDLDT